MIEGKYVGVIEHSLTDTRFVTVQFDGRGGQVDGQPLAIVQARGKRVQFGRDGWEARGRREGDLINGTAFVQGKAAALRLIRVADLDPSIYAEADGLYELEQDRFLCIARTPAYVYVFDTGTRFTGPLFPTAPDAFFVGDGRLTPLPVRRLFTFQRDSKNQIVGLDWETADGARGFAPKVTRWHERQVTFQSEGATLAGTLRLPLGENACPGVVLVHGSGPQTRSGALCLLAFHAMMLTLHGIATLTYDKRGVGDSTCAQGTWETAGFAEFSCDALAGIRLLQQHPQVDARRVGTWGISQGAWIAPYAALQAGDAAFSVLVSGGGVDGEAQEIKRVELTMRADGYAEDVIAQGVEIQRRKFHYARTREGWDDYLMLALAARDEVWFQRIIDPPLTQDHTAWDWWRVNNAYDHRATLRALDCPLLAILGTHDTLTPTEETVRAFAEILREKDTVRVFPQADHVLFEAENGGIGEAARLKGFVPGYLEATIEWMQAAAGK
jgi:uncharacterized protein